MHLSKKQKAFTLVELLVVIGIIAILVGLLLPSLSRTRLQAQTVACSAQLRSLGQGLMIYTQNSRGHFPTWSGWHVVGGDGTGEDSPGEAWIEQLARSFTSADSQAYNCPAFPHDRKINYFLSSRYSFVTGRRSYKIDEIKLGSRFVMSGDCTQPSLYPAPFGDTGFELDDADKDDATQPGIVWANEPGGLNIHRKGNNLLFADGHVGFYDRFEATDMTFHPKRMSSWENVTP